MKGKYFDKFFFKIDIMNPYVCISKAFNKSIVVDI